MDGQGLLVEPLSWSQLRQKDVYSQGGQLNRGKGEGAAEKASFQVFDSWAFGAKRTSQVELESDFRRER